MLSLRQRRVRVPTVSGLSLMGMKIYTVESRRMPSYSRVLYHQKWPRTHFMVEVTRRTSTKRQVERTPAAAARSPAESSGTTPRTVRVERRASRPASASSHTGCRSGGVRDFFSASESQRLRSGTPCDCATASVARTLHSRWRPSKNVRASIIVLPTLIAPCSSPSIKVHWNAATAASVTVC